VKRAELYKNIDQGSISPVYFFVGDEDALIDDALASLEGKIFISPESMAFNRDVVMSCSGDGERILSLARAFPLLVKRRLVVVREADKLSQQDWDSLASYLKNPPLSACLVFVLEKAPSVASPVNVVDFSVKDGSEIKDFIVKELNIRGKKILPQAMDVLQRMAWDSLQELRQEIEKLSIYVGEKKAIDIDDLICLCSVRTEIGAFALTDALGNRNAQEALRNLGAIIEGGGKEIGILARLANHFRRLVITRSILEKGGSDQDVKEALGGRNYPVRMFAAQANRFSAKELLDLFRKFFESDVGLKGGALDYRIVMEKLILEIAGYPRT